MQSDNEFTQGNYKYLEKQSEVEWINIYLHTLIERFCG